MPDRPRTHRPLHAGPRRSSQQSDRQRYRDQSWRQLLCRNYYRKFRAWLIAQRPVCERCQREPSAEVHHRRKLALHPEDLCDADHCEALCKSCHSRATGSGE